MNWVVPDPLFFSGKTHQINAKEDSVMGAIAINATPVSKKFNDNVIELYPDKEHEFVMTYAQVAKGFGCCEGTIRSAKKEHADELIEGKHLITSTVGNSNSRKQLKMKKVYWTKRGIVRLGFFLRSERAKQFRDWAEDLIIRETEKKPTRKALGKGLELPEQQDNIKKHVASHLQMMFVSSDAMQGEYEIGEAVFFDTKKTVGDGVFVVRIGNSVDVRRIQHNPDRSIIILKKTNPKYNMVDVTSESSVHLTVLGRVVGKMQREYIR